MKKTVFFVICTMILSFVSCASIQYHKPTVERLSYPEVGKEIEKNVGDILLEQGNRFISLGVVFKADSQNGAIRKGAYRETGSQQGYLVYAPIELSGAKVEGTGLVPNRFLAMKDKNLMLCAYGGFGNIFPFVIVPENEYKSETVAVDDIDSFQQTLIYTGKEKSIIKFSYREYSGNIARPAYTIDVTYDIDESKDISFKKARIRILSATNTSIRYVVLSNF